MDSYFCLELTLEPLSELVIRQIGKSNVQWFTYPFLPPTTFSGLVYSMLVSETDEDWVKNYIELNDNHARQVQQKLDGVIAVGAYPELNKFARNKHYRQHLGRDSFNYEHTVWKGNKKLAIAESFWTPSLRGFLLSKSNEPLQKICDNSDLLFRVARAGKKGMLKFVEAQLHKIENQSFNGIPSCIVPLELIYKIPSKLDITYVPLQAKMSNGELTWKSYPCVFGCEVKTDCYTNGKTISIPRRLVELLIS